MTSWPPPRWGAHLPDGVLPGDVDLAQGHTLAGAWAAAWARDPRREVLRSFDGIRMSAGELAERSALAAGRYAAAGLRPGDPVLMSAPPSLDLIVSYVGAIRYGLTVVPANTAYTAAELAHLVEDAGPLVAVVDDPRRLDGTYLSCATPDLGGLPPARDGIPLDLATPDDIALIVYTSGTTGKPKGALLTHANLLASAHAIRLAWRWTPDDRLVLCLPLFHVHGLGVGLHGSLVAGGSAVVLPGFDAAAVGTAIREHEASMFFGVPTMYHRLAGSPHLSELARLRLAVSGSAPLAAELHAAIGAGSGQQVLERYGMSETMMLVSNPYDGERRPGTVGFPLPGVGLRLSDGQIEVRGPNVFSGYFRRPEATEQAFTDDGWFRTGDLGKLDADGYLRIQGRTSELIITGGYNVYPREVEEVLSAHPGVSEAVVTGVPSKEWGELVAAFVVPRNVVNMQRLERDLVDWCGDQLASYKRPRVWRFIERVPRNALGKPLRHELRP
jgi:malonyl-CoA/methylmalonyl-CoA synthetase